MPHIPIIDMSQTAKNAKLILKQQGFPSDIIDFKEFTFVKCTQSKEFAARKYGGISFEITMVHKMGFEIKISRTA